MQRLMPGEGASAPVSSWPVPLQAAQAQQVECNGEAGGSWSRQAELPNRQGEICWPAMHMHARHCGGALGVANSGSLARAHGQQVT